MQLLSVRARQPMRKRAILTLDMALTWHAIIKNFGNFFKTHSLRAFGCCLATAISSKVIAWCRFMSPPPLASCGWRNTPATAALKRYKMRWNERKWDWDERSPNLSGTFLVELQPDLWWHFTRRWCQTFLRSRNRSRQRKVKISSRVWVVADLNVPCSASLPIRI